MHSFVRGSFIFRAGGAAFPISLCFLLSSSALRTPLSRLASCESSGVTSSCQRQPASGLRVICSVNSPSVAEVPQINRFGGLGCGHFGGEPTTKGSS